MLTVREYCSSDRDAVTELLVELQSHLVSVDNENIQILSDQYRRQYLNMLLAALAENNGKLYVAIRHDIIIGMVAGYIEPKDEDDRLTNRCPKRGKVLELVVSDKERSGGIGSLLLKKIENYFAEQNCEFICVDVFVPNRRAMHFYEGNAYAPRNIEMYKHIGENT